MNTVENLLKPRYEVVALYPNSKFPIGLIINMNRFGIPRYPHIEPEEVWESEFLEIEGFSGFIYEAMFSPYPHLFRKLKWWEHRKPEELPEYVKDTQRDRVYKVAHPSQNQRIWHVEGEIEHRFAYNGNYEPATEEEYIKHLNSK